MRNSWALVGVLAVTVALVGCIGAEDDPVTATDAPDPATNESEPSSPLPAEITGLSSIDTVSTDGSGTGIWIDEQRDLLLSANGGGGLHVFDVGDPHNVTHLGSVGDVSARDVDLLRWNGTPYAVASGGSEGVHVVDVSDPAAPELVATADAYGSHNLAAVQGTPYVYDSQPVGALQKAQGAFVPVLDLSTPSDPSWTTIPMPASVNGQPIQSDGCHDIWVQEELDRAYCAGGGSATVTYGHGGGETFVWNISEGPTQPTWEGLVDHPSIMYHHQAVPSEDGDHLYVNDEFLAPNCRNAATPGPAPDAKQSTAAMWIFDISDPANPRMEAYVQNPEDTPHANCGSHFGDRVDGRDVLVWGWYGGGTMLVNVSEPANPVVLDEAEAVGSTWDARYHDGSVFSSSGDLQVLDLVAEEG